MARFFSYHEITSGLITTPELIGEIALALQELEIFKQGKAVIFGSVAWGDHRWRSDIDVADFSKNYWQSSTPVDSILSDFFQKRFGSNSGFYIKEHLMEVLSHQGSHAQGNYVLPKISPSTRDHFRLLAKAKGGPWKEFFKKLKTVPFRSRQEDIAYYLNTIKCRQYWLNERLIGKKWLDWNDFKTLQSLENFPKQLVRKILGEKKKLPSPDTVSNIMAQFALLDELWAKELSALFQPFFLIDETYKNLADHMTKDETISENDYGQEVCRLFTALPVMTIITIIKNAYNLHNID